MDTASTPAIVDAVRARVLDFVPVAPSPLAGGSLRSRGFKLYASGAVPDAAGWSGAYGILRPMNLLTSAAGLRVAGDLELMLLARPRNPWGAQLEVYADAVDQAMHNVGSTDAAGTRGLFFTRGRSRDTLPPFPDPADREVVQVRLVYGVVVYPRSLTALGTLGRTA